jgi:hypothetical protein
MKNTRDLIEIFGYQPTDTSKNVRMLWQLGACPFINKACTKINHDQSITYGTCSVTSPYGNIIICPNRMYVNNYQIIKNVANDAFGELPVCFLMNLFQGEWSLKLALLHLVRTLERKFRLGNHYQWIGYWQKLITVI